MPRKPKKESKEEKSKKRPTNSTFDPSKEDCVSRICTLTHRINWLKFDDGDKGLAEKFKNDLLESIDKFAKNLSLRRVYASLIATLLFNKKFNGIDDYNWICLTDCNFWRSLLRCIPAIQIKKSKRKDEKVNNLEKISEAVKQLENENLFKDYQFPIEHLKYDGQAISYLAKQMKTNFENSVIANFDKRQLFEIVIFICFFDEKFIKFKQSIDQQLIDQQSNDYIKILKSKSRYFFKRSRSIAKIIQILINNFDFPIQFDENKSNQPIKDIKMTVADQSMTDLADSFDFNSKTINDDDDNDEYVDVDDQNEEFKEFDEYLFEDQNSKSDFKFNNEKYKLPYFPEDIKLLIRDFIVSKRNLLIDLKKKSNYFYLNQKNSNSINLAVNYLYHTLNYLQVQQFNSPIGIKLFNLIPISDIELNCFTIDKIVLYDLYKFTIKSNNYSKTNKEKLEKNLEFGTKSPIECGNNLFTKLINDDYLSHSNDLKFQQYLVTNGKWSSFLFTKPKIQSTNQSTNEQLSSELLTKPIQSVFNSPELDLSISADLFDDDYLQLMELSPRIEQITTKPPPIIDQLTIEESQLNDVDFGFETTIEMSLIGNSSTISSFELISNEMNKQLIDCCIESHSNIEEKFEFNPLSTLPNERLIELSPLSSYNGQPCVANDIGREYVIFSVEIDENRNIHSRFITRDDFKKARDDCDKDGNLKDAEQQIQLIFKDLNEATTKSTNYQFIFDYCKFILKNLKKISDIKFKPERINTIWSRRRIVRQLIDQFWESINRPVNDTEITDKPVEAKYKKLLKSNNFIRFGWKNRIEKDIPIIVGDCGKSGTNKKGESGASPSSKMEKQAKAIHGNRIKVVSEFRTSRICPYCGDALWYCYITVDGKKKFIRSMLYCSNELICLLHKNQTKDQLKGFIHRDFVGALNQAIIGNSIGKRPEILTRNGGKYKKKIPTKSKEISKQLVDQFMNNYKGGHYKVSELYLFKKKSSLITSNSNPILIDQSSSLSNSISISKNLDQSSISISFSFNLKNKHFNQKRKFENEEDENSRSKRMKK